MNHSKKYKEIYDRYHDPLLQFAKGMLRSGWRSECAEDIVQNVFMKLWENVDRLGEIKSIHNWLFTCVRNEILNLFKSKWAKPVQTSEGLVCPDMSTEQDLAYQELYRSLKETVRTMPDKRGEVFTKSRIENMTNEEIAKDMGLSVRTVEKHIQLAIKDFKRKMN